MTQLLWPIQKEKHSSVTDPGLIAGLVDTAAKGFHAI